MMGKADGRMRQKREELLTGSLQAEPESQTARICRGAPAGCLSCLNAASERGPLIWAALNENKKASESRPASQQS